MPDEFSNADAELALKELELKISERLRRMEAAVESPQMNSAVGRLSYIDAYQQEQMSLHGQRQLRIQLTAIRAAIERLRAGTYGVCIGCGTAIPRDRLEYMPETPYCVKCNAQTRGR